MHSCMYSLPGPSPLSSSLPLSLMQRSLIAESMLSRGASPGEADQRHLIHSASATYVYINGVVLVPTLQRRRGSTFLLLCSSGTRLACMSLEVKFWAVFWTLLSQLLAWFMHGVFAVR